MQLKQLYQHLKHTLQEATEYIRYGMPVKNITLNRR